MVALSLDNRQRLMHFGYSYVKISKFSSNNLVSKSRYEVMLNTHNWHMKRKMISFFIVRFGFKTLGNVKYI